MFVRFRQTKRRVQVSLVENRRGDGRVRQEHIAWLGAIATEPSIDDRIAFWRQLHERLAMLSNRVDANTQAKVLADIHARIPMVMIEEQHGLKLENAETDERFWTGLREMHEEQIEGQRQLIASAERAIAKGQSAAANAAANAAEAKDRAERLKRGEDVPGGLDKPVDLERVLREAGLTTRDINHMKLLAAIPEKAMSAVHEISNEAFRKAGERAERAAVRRFVRHLLELLDGAA